MPEEGKWRTSSAYDYLEQLDPPALAWEFLRRNPAYRQEFAELSRTGPIDSDAAAALVQRWGLQFRGGSSAHRRGNAGLLDPGNGPRDAAVDAGTDPDEPSDP